MALLAFCFSNAQESIDPLHALPSAITEASLKVGGLNEIFIYLNASQDLPLMDDFSIDRTRHLNASSSDGNVTLIGAFYHLDSMGVSYDTMAYSTTPSIRTVVDTITFANDTTWVDTLPSFPIEVYDLGIYPVISSTVDCWMPYDILDSVVAGGTNSIFIDRLPDLVQDSLFVYEVQADSRTCECTGSPKPLILWQDDDAFINGTYPIDPPTIGVATLEGLARTGYPYDFTSTAYGVADHLTTVPINMGYPASDSIYLSFYYQPQGLSGDNVVQAQDSLFLEFYDVLNDQWKQRWSVGYSALQPFNQVMIPIIELEYLQNDFQFRFKNLGSLAGALDHWHIDYVRLARQRAYDDTVLVDVSYLYPETSLLAPYTSVPYKHFENSPASYMVDTLFLDQKNLDVNDRFITYGMRVGLRDDPVSSYDDFPLNGNNIMNNASSTFASHHPVNSDPNFYTYAVNTSDSCAFWRSQFYTNATPDINRCNDTTEFVQELSNYYAYDDGSAEAGYNLNVAGAKLAYRFDMPFPDTLKAVRMYFDPIFEDPSSGSFLITIWSDLAPETIIHQNVSFSSPEFRTDGVNHFVEYQLDALVAVPNQFYVGWVQTSSAKMNLGFDRNRNNSDKIFFNVSTVFNPTTFEGSLMMRPVFANYKDPFLSVNDTDSGTDQFTLYPNPAHEFVRFDFGDMDPGSLRISISDAQGSVVRNYSDRSDGVIPISDLAAGYYHVTLINDRGERAVRALVIEN